MTNLSELAILSRAQAARSAWRAAKSREWLESTYARQLYGGWEREDGRWIEEPHLLGMRFHEACKSLWCPVCLLCNKTSRECHCRPPQACWSYLGQIGKDWTDTFRCPTHPQHGDIPARQALYKSVFGLAGNLARAARPQPCCRRPVPGPSAAAHGTTR